MLPCATCARKGAPIAKALATARACASTLTAVKLGSYAGVALLLVSACDKGRSPVAEPVAANESGAGTPSSGVVDLDTELGVVADEFVLAKPGAVLYADPEMTRPVLTVGKGYEDPAPLLLQVIAVDRDVVGVRLRPVDYACAAGIAGIEWAQIELTMRGEDLALVTRRMVDREFADGTRLSLAAGVPISDPEQFSVDVEVEVDGGFGRLTIPRSVSRSEVGYSFVSPLEFEFGGAYFGTADGAQVELAEGPLQLPPGALLRDGTAAKPALLASVQGPCVRATVRTSGKAFEQLPDGSHKVAGEQSAPPPAVALPGRSSRRFKVDIGSTIFWQDGREAGRAIASTTLEQTPSDVDGRTCFSPPGEQRWYAEGVRICFEKDAVARAGGTGEGTIGLGNVGLIGKGSGRKPGVPRVRQSKAAVVGALDKDIIRRIVRSHINEVRKCYTSVLAKDPGLKGRVAIKFTIGPDGKVRTSGVDSDDTGSATLGPCIAHAVASWKFPKPKGGGNVVVTYPFVLEPG